jgi:YYY domain-containing protein
MEYGLVALWLALYLLLGYVGATVAAALFPRFAERGVAFGVPVALATLWIVTYVVGRVSITAGVWLGLLGLVGAAVLLVTRYDYDTVDTRAYAEVAVVFAVAFCFVVAFRAFDPAINPIAGEKFLDYGLLRSLMRAETLPPEDMWFAGEPVAYYYGGHLVAAILTRLTGTAGQYAYNLALSGFYATLVTGVYGLAGAIAADRSVPRRLAAGLSAFFVGFASNLTTPVRAVLWLLPDSLASSIAGTFGYELVGLAAGRDQFSYWSASRVIQDDPSDFATYTPGGAYSINEFPLFAWLNGDMHAHMMSTGFLVLAAALCFSYYQTPATERRRRLALLFGALPAVGGLMAVTNTWSFPSIAGLALLTVAMAPASPATLLPDGIGDVVPTDGAGHEVGRIGLAVGAAVGVALLGLLWSLPFWLGAASGREVTYLPDRIGLFEVFAVHGLFLVPFALYLYAQAGQLLGTDRARLLGAGTIAAIIVGTVTDLAAVGVVGPVLLGAWLFARSPTLSRSLDAVPAMADGGSGSAGGRATAGHSSDGSDRPVGFEAVLVVAGAGLVLLVEFVFLKENVGRMNTVFKTYMQVWVLWAAAVGPALAWLATRWRPDGDQTRSLVRTGSRVFVVLLVCSTAVYGVLALSDHGTTDDPTVNGTAYLDDDHPEEAEAIRWLDREIDGRPTIVTGVTRGYTWDADSGQGGSAPASLTGLPTVVGWSHEAQYRNDSLYNTRTQHVGDIYRGNESLQRTRLQQYDVQYIYSGPAEQARYRDITVGQLDAVRPVHQSGEVTIYYVDQNEL